MGVSPLAQRGLDAALGLAVGLWGVGASEALFEAESGTFTSPIEQWRFTNFGSIFNTGPALDTADSDNDGTANLLEYATKMNPITNDTVPQSATKNGSGIDFIYTKNKAATDVTITIEWSDTLLNDWSTSGISAPTVLSDNGITQQIKVTVPAGSGVMKRFVHLKVTRP